MLGAGFSNRRLASFTALLADRGFSGFAVGAALFPLSLLARAAAGQGQRACADQDGHADASPKFQFGLNHVSLAQSRGATHGPFAIHSQ